MSRSGYSDDGESETLGLWRQAVTRAIQGKRGQAFLKEMAAALDAMPVKELIDGDIVRSDNNVCAIGAVALARKMDVKGLDVTDGDAVGKAFGVAPSLVQEIAYLNDDEFDYYRDASPAKRWERMRKWVAENILPEKST